MGLLFIFKGTFLYPSPLFCSPLLFSRMKNKKTGYLLPVSLSIILASLFATPRSLYSKTLIKNAYAVSSSSLKSKYSSARIFG